MQFILYCMTISTYVQYTGNLIHPVDPSGSRDLASITIIYIYIYIFIFFLKLKQNSFYHYNVCLAGLCINSRFYAIGVLNPLSCNTTGYPNIHSDPRMI